MVHVTREEYLQVRSETWKAEDELVKKQCEKDKLESLQLVCDRRNSFYPSVLSKDQIEENLVRVQTEITAASDRLKEMENHLAGLKYEDNEMMNLATAEKALSSKQREKKELERKLRQLGPSAMHNTFPSDHDDSLAYKLSQLALNRVKLEIQELSAIVLRLKNPASPSATA